MTVFSVFTLLTILTITGIGIDLMRLERDRASLQYTLDRAVLAAADLDQSLSPADVVNDYLDKAGLGQYLTGVSVNQGLGYRIVSAQASTDMETQFMHMTGVDSLNAPAASTAEESVGGVEISMVLDVSGSMGSNSRLVNLKVAAKDFIDTMVNNTEDGKLSISIVPYATQVSMPSEFLDRFNISNEHSFSNCVNWQTSDFSTTTLTTSQSLQRTMHFDPWTYDPWDDHDGRADGQLVGRPICSDEESRESIIMSRDATALKNFIENFYADGNTSIDVAMKWGTTLLDPSIQPVISQMVDDGEVESIFSARPTSYASGDTLKVVVLMSDGQNTSQYYVNSQFRSGDSNIWWNSQEDTYSVYNPSSGSYYWPHNDSWQDHPYGNGTYTETTWTCNWWWYGNCYDWDSSTETIDEPGSASVVSYPELWAYTAMERHVEFFYEPWMNDNQAWNDWYYGVRNYVGYSTKDTRTDTVCQAAKDNNIIVYTIGFEAPSRGLSVLQACASSDSHFYDVDGLEITDAFSSIASSIRKLRLTQ